MLLLGLCCLLPVTQMTSGLSLLNKRGQKRKENSSYSKDSHSDGHLIEETVQESAELKVPHFYWEKNKSHILNM